VTRVLRFIADYWYVPLLVCAGIVGWIFVQKILGNPGIDPLKLAQSELEAIDAKRQARNLKLELGAEQATRRVKVKYAQKLAALNEQEKAEAADLEQDPEKLALFLARVTE
jgi:hypothetical protein